MAALGSEGYGKVSDLCHSLGYGRGGDASKGSRSYLALSQKTIEFRKNFIKQRRVTTFPLQCEDPIAETCASEFLNANAHLFDHSEESRDNSWLSLPDDRAKYV